MATFIDGYEIDVATDESHVFDAMVTGDPVEDGADTSDNVKLQPISLTMTGIVSDTPFGNLAQRRQATAAEGDNPMHSSFALDFLLELRDRREPVTVETGMRKYANMVLERLSIPQNARIGDSLQFSATFKQIRVVSTERTTVTVAVPRLKNKKKKGVTAPFVFAGTEIPQEFVDKAKTSAAPNRSQLNRFIR